MNPPPAANSSAIAFDPWLLWVAFRKHWGWCIPLGVLLGSVAALGIYSTFEKQYEATHLLEYNRDFVVFPSMQGLGRDLARSERQLILKGQVLDPVLADPALNAAPSLSNPNTAEREIQNRLTISNGGTDNYLLISYRDSNAVQAANVCNAIVDSYIRIRENSAEKRSEEIQRWLRPSINEWKATVSSKREAVATITKENLGYDPYKEGSSLEQNGVKLQILSKDKVDLVSEITVIKARRQSAESLAPSAPPVPDPSEVQSYVNNDPDVRRLQSRIESHFARIAELERKDQADNIFKDTYQRLVRESEDFERELAILKDGLRAKAVDDLTKINAERVAEAQRQQIRDYDRTLSDLETRLVNVEKEIDIEKKQLQQLAGETAELYFAKQDHEQSAEILNHLEQKMAMIKTESRRNSSIQSVSKAKPPLYAVEEVPFKKLGMAGFAGFLTPFAIALLLEFLIKRIVDSKRLEATVKAPVLGEISRYTGGGLNDYSRRMFTESIDALRANLSFKLDGVRSIVVTSAMPSEGKSSVASQLAISLAKAFEEPVLLIDADVRLPGLHSMFKISFGPGLTNVLKGQVSAEEAINTSPGDLVHVLTAGKLSGSPHTLMSRKNLEAFLDTVPEKYRYIVIDTAPVLPAAETLALAAAADATVICAMRDVSRMDHLARAQRQLEAAGANILGTVFSGIPSREYAYRYGDYRYAYSEK
jgi:polysaccharide biosynthesis transport protein